MDTIEPRSEATKRPREAEELMEAYLYELREEALDELRRNQAQFPVCEEPEPKMGEDIWHYVDDVSGAKLDAKLVAEARKAELDTIAQMGVWKVVDRPDDKKVIGARWVDTNKGDSAKPNYRSRYVAKELKATTLGDFFAAMPPLASLKMLLSLAVTKAYPNASGKVEYRKEQHLLSFVDKASSLLQPGHKRGLCGAAR